MANMPSSLPALLRKAGLTVVEVDGWKTRKRPGSFAPVGVLNHHTGASAKGWSKAKELAYAKWMFTTGRSDLPAPLCQIALGRSGTVYVGAAGRANHAGTAKASGSVSAGDGNSLYIGIEWMLSGTEAIPVTMKNAGITLNAVLTEKITDNQKGTSVQTISCHYNTSTTGKWDIGDPNGVPFKGTKVLDIPKFRTSVQAKRRALYAPKPPAATKPPVKVPVKTVDIQMGHASLQYSDSLSQWKHDTEAIFSRGYSWLTGTEAGEKDHWDILVAAAKKYGYTLRRFRSNWIGLKRTLITKGSFTWGTQIIAKAADVAGPGHDTSFLWVTFTHTTAGVGKVSVIASHYPTKGRPGTGENSVNLKWTKKAAADISAKAKELGAGAALVFYGGDQNINDKTDDTFFGQPLTSCWDELKTWPKTHWATIDVIASYDADGRVKCVAAKSHSDKSLMLYTDHFLIQATYRIDLKG